MESYSVVDVDKKPNWINIKLCL